MMDIRKMSIAELESKLSKINWIVRHIQANEIVAAFQHWDIAKGYVDRGHQIGHWKPHELVIESATDAAREVKRE